MNSPTTCLIAAEVGGFLGKEGVFSASYDKKNLISMLSAYDIVYS